MMHWSQRTRVRVNGRAIKGVEAGQYLAVQRRWRRGDTVDIHLDMSLHYWVGEDHCEGKTSVFRGPVLLTYCRRLNDMDPDDVPALDAAGLKGPLVRHTGPPPEPIVLMEFTGIDGRKVRLCDFGSAGEAGCPYRSWLDIRNVQPTLFSRGNPLRSARIINKE